MFAPPSDVVTVLIFDLGVILGFYLLCLLLKPERMLDRILFSAVTAGLIVIYTIWRWTDTLPEAGTAVERLWPTVFFACEFIAILYTLLSIMILLRRIDRSPEADIALELRNSLNRWPAVDIFICTYNEPIEVLEKSILLALAIDYGPKTVWVLDDTRRPWVEQLCAEVGARYLKRANNHGAKAGNLNNALRATSLETNAPLILVLDADFAPQPNILTRMVGLFHDPKAAVVQTPQFFYNADPIQHNLMVQRSWVDDQRIFFDVFQPAKDAWGCAFCVGTSFLVRRDRLELIGGFPDEAICEDLNLSYTLMRKGYRTHWLNERLSVGLSAEGLPEYISQRMRWCLGTIQVALLKDGPIFGAGYSFIQRLQFVHGLLNWFCKPFIVLMLIAPAIYWFAGLPAFEADYLTFLRYGLPALIALWAYNGWVSRARTLPIFMEVTHTITALAITVTLISAMIRPFGRPFKVTDKGGDRSLMVVRWKMAAVFGSMTLLSAISVVWAYISPYSSSEISPIDFFNLLWAGFSMFMTFVAFLICFELPREEERFAIEAGSFIWHDGRFSACTLVDLSTRLARLRFDGESDGIKTATHFRILIPNIGWVAASARGGAGDIREFVLHPEPNEHRQLVVQLFSGPRTNIAATADINGAFSGLYRRAFGIRQS
ncbi:MAG TPA: cellulose synthase catalytic subunit [Ensifer sp.]|jgi:cellulose synthase (UDP-forming)|uniref:glycosyltransferase family 2 protein n=1 Tax=Ensifer sp. TaxID=1872086 RepID=UPI002E146072|nr:cellulose synthase catalytic subunit [Ensifer sp.]